MAFNNLPELEWLEPWGPVWPASESALKAEVLAEHPLLSEEIRVIGRRGDCDDVLLSLPDNQSAFAVVHLTWSKKEEKVVRNQLTFYSSLWDWMENCMIPTHAEWNIS